MPLKFELNVFPNLDSKFYKLKSKNLYFKVVQMVEVEGYVFPEDLYHTDRHLWVRKEADGTLTIGFNDLAQKLIGKIMFIRLPKVGAPLTPGKDFGTVESMKWVERLKSPVTGIVKDVNAQLRTKPALVHQDPYGAGWLMKIQPTGDVDAELSKLAHGSALLEWAKKEVEEKAKKKA
jgi:glycine cleavage system H protein